MIKTYFVHRLNSLHKSFVSEQNLVLENATILALIEITANVKTAVLGFRKNHGALHSLHILLGHHANMNIHKMTPGFLTYTCSLGIIQAVSLITVAGVTLSCVVADPLATNIRTDLALIHL